MSQTIVLRKTKSGYNLDSFHRFGDDLCELLLSYLSIEEKIIYECVSKQWKQLLFNKQKVLSIHPNECDNKLFERLSSLKFSNYEIVLKNLIQKFKFTHEINLWISGLINDKNLIEIGLKFGQRLRSINIIDINNKQMETLLRSTHNLKTIYMNHNIKAILKQSLKKLQEIIITSPSDSDHFKLFADQYYKQIKKVSVSFCGFKIEEILMIFQQIPRFQNLEAFHLKLMATYFGFSDQLIIIGQKCTKLKRVKGFISKHSMNRNLFQTFGEYKGLNELYLHFLSIDINRTGKLHELNNCKNLKSLKLKIDCLTDQHFEAFESSFSSLEYLSICGSGVQITDNTLKKLSKMPNLSKLVIKSYKITVSGIADLIKNSPQMRAIHLSRFPLNDTALQQAVEELSKKAINNPKTLYKLIITESQQFEQINNYKNARNLIIKKVLSKKLYNIYFQCYHHNK